MKKSEFDDLMERYVTGNVTEQEKAKIEAWLEVMQTEDNIDLELTKEDEDRIFRKLTSTITTIDDVIALRQPRKPRVHQWVIRIAASLVIVVLLSYVAWNYIDRKQDPLEIISGTRGEKVILEDGSLVWLRADSKLTYDYSRGEGVRYSTFRGEGLFEIAKDSDHPFIVDCGGLKVRVVGTSFNLKTTIDQVELTVLTGKVNVSSPSVAGGLDVIPNEKVIYQADGAIEKLLASEVDMMTATKDTDYHMEFTNNPIRDVLRRIEDKFNIKIDVSDPAILNCRVQPVYDCE